MEDRAKLFVSTATWDMDSLIDVPVRSLDKLHKLIDKKLGIPTHAAEKGATLVEFTVVPGYDDERVLRVEYLRYETDAECETRIGKEAARRERERARRAEKAAAEKAAREAAKLQKEADERALYEKLKAKYE